MPAHHTCDGRGELQRGDRAPDAAAAADPTDAAAGLLLLLLRALVLLLLLLVLCLRRTAPGMPGPDQMSLQCSRGSLQGLEALLVLLPLTLLAVSRLLARCSSTSTTGGEPARGGLVLVARLPGAGACNAVLTI
jgi:uncharacterized membrane protein